MTERKDETSQIHTIKTAIKLLAPHEVGVRLVSADHIDKIEYSFFWCSIFFGILTAILGALISIWASGISAGGVQYILLVFLIIFFILAITFGISGFKQRKKSRLIPTTSQTDETPEKPDAERMLWLMGIMKDIQEDMLEIVFSDNDELTEQDLLKVFMKRFRDDVPPDAVEMIINNVLADMGMLSKVEKPDGKRVFKINKEFNIDHWFQSKVLPMYYRTKKT